MWKDDAKDDKDKWYGNVNMGLDNKYVMIIKIVL